MKKPWARKKVEKEINLAFTILSRLYLLFSYRLLKFLWSKYKFIERDFIFVFFFSIFFPNKISLERREDLVFIRSKHFLCNYSQLRPIRISAVSGQMILSLEAEFNAFYSGLRGTRAILSGPFSVRIGRSWLYTQIQNIM